ncbi:hypothetical protein HHUSO_G32507 [Huso huso]|uniref:Uncharacterized protein n=1 Tax=Huso huso TaxID=61971 RepID=A0ABR0YA59_HUSHU
MCSVKSFCFPALKYITLCSSSDSRTSAAPCKCETRVPVLSVDRSVARLSGAGMEKTGEQNNESESVKARISICRADCALSKLRSGGPALIEY